jgi:hypothetical protein
MTNKDVNKGLSNLQQQFHSWLGPEPTKPVHPIAVRIFGYPLAGMISQLLFWTGKQANKDGYIWKTEKEFIRELGISSSQQKTAINLGRKLGFLEVKRKGIPAKRHYKIDYEVLIKATLKLAKTKNIELIKSFPQLGDNQPTITDDTQNNNQIRTSDVTPLTEILIKKFK